MVEFVDIKRDLPDWPDEVIEEWLLKLANRSDTGWPPPEPLGNHPWKYILGARPLSWWKEVTWTLEEHQMNFDALAKNSKRIVKDMIDGHINRVPNTYFGWPESKARFLSAGQYVSQYGTFPKPPMAVRLDDGLSVLDGNHRMTALCFRQLAPERILKLGGVPPLKKHQVWIGKHARGEVPY
jgi:hypothetical protein